MIATNAATAQETGKIVYYSTAEDDNEEIYVSEGDTQERLTFNGWRDRWPAWNSEGTKIVFASEQGGGGFTADITGGEDLGGGCVLLTGTSTCVFPGFGVFFDEPLTLTVCTGGPDQGVFTVCFDNFVEEFGCEEETVINGVIN